MRHVCVVGHISAAFNSGAVAISIMRIVRALIGSSRDCHQADPIQPPAHIISVVHAVGGGHTVGDACDVVVIVMGVG